MAGIHIHVPIELDISEYQFIPADSFCESVRALAWGDRIPPGAGLRHRLS